MFRSKLATTAAALLLIFVAFTALWLRTPSPVSARAIFEHAYAAQQTQGIHHLRLEQYTNLELVSMIQGAKLPSQEISSISESYRDLASGKYRSVTTNTADNRVTYVSGYDGSYLYSSAEESTPLAVYRSPVPAGWYEIYGYDSMVANEMAPQEAYELARQAPDTTLVGEEQWVDGRQAYVLRASLSLADQAIEAYNLSYFDKTTYKFLESRTLIVQDGKESVATFARYLADEILPADAAVAWDLSDVQGITIVEDATGERTGPWLAAITQQELVARVPNAYLLSTVPEGFTQTIAASKHQGEENVYLIMYRSKTGSYILLQPDDGTNRITDEGATTYTTASGLTLTFKPAASEAEGTYAIVTASDATFSISSSLPRSQIEALAETLILAK
jgi:hypothetical protein